MGNLAFNLFSEFLLGKWDTSSFVAFVYLNGDWMLHRSTKAHGVIPLKSC